MSSQEIEQFETHMDKMDRLTTQHKHELALAQEETKRAKIAARANRNETIVYMFSILAAAAVVLGILAAIFFGVRGPSAEEMLRQEQIKMCTEAGKDWVPEQKTAEGGTILVKEHCETGADNE